MVQLQDQLLSAVAELERLALLISHAGDELMSRFAQIARISEQIGSAELRGEVSAALIALQFQDMAGQLVQHSTARIQAVADLIGAASDGEPSPPADLPTRASPVAQHALDAGSADLFC